MTSFVAFLFERVRFERLLAIPYGWLYRMLFQRMGVGTFVSPFIQSVGLDRVSLGDRSRISRNTRLLALKAYGSQVFDPQIDIGDNVSIGFGCTLSCINRIEISHDVTIGDNVYIADSHHDYRDTNLGILQQPLLPGKVSIGRGAWVGYGAFVAGNVSLGDHSVVGANSVVTRSVPAYTVVAGVPAKPVRRFSHELGQWIRIDAGSQEDFGKLN
ncbi:DapH/DapD/GlmU-related protein [Polaromonas sp.]|uniref:acyltransferase n=1 Tax=Polaromonas sp. TaxID=1869339 RepID=UPI00272FD335|nr:acyltransferase [Polaromonas sp.]MDP1740195.1 acyltransferase [Polaromonas sp.]